MAAERDRLPSAIVEAANDRRGGATEVARRALEGLLEIAGDRELLELAAEVLAEGQPAMAPMWHLVATASHSSQVDAVLHRLGQRVVVVGAGRRNAVVAVVGSDAIGPKALLNAAGTRLLAARLPTLVVSSPLKLVPASAFARLAAPGFEAVPLDLVTAVALGPELLAPTAAGRRAAALEGPQRRGSTRR